MPGLRVVNIEMSTQVLLHPYHPLACNRCNSANDFPESTRDDIRLRVKTSGDTSFKM
jgi:hypothetical protein